jgi:hypothetical protein
MASISVSATLVGTSNLSTWIIPDVVEGFGASPYGESAYGGEPDTTFRLISARSINHHTTTLTFSGPPKLDSAETLDPANYFIQSTPGGHILRVQRVIPDSDPNSLQVLTDEQVYSLYNLQLGSLISISGEPLDPSYSTTRFTGFPSHGTFTAQSIRTDAVLVLFNQAMLVDSNLTNPLNYLIQDVTGSMVTVTNVVPNYLSNPTRVTLQLGSSVIAGVSYYLTVSRSVVSSSGMTVLPPTSVISWFNKHPLAKIPISSFSGEVQGSLFGNPQGLVFFSPALVPGGSPNSVLQIEGVETCTDASDTYRIPPTSRATPSLYIFNNLRPSGPPQVSVLNRDFLFTDFYQMNEAQMNLLDNQEDIIEPPVDIGASLRMVEVYPPTRVALLNSPGWILNGGGANPPYPFVTADNLSPLPPPVVSPSTYFTNPLEHLVLTEELSAIVQASVNTTETLVLEELLDLQPGVNVVQVNVSETLTLSEGLSFTLGINMSETLTLTENLTLSF